MPLSQDDLDREFNQTNSPVVSQPTTGTGVIDQDALEKEFQSLQANPSPQVTPPPKPSPVTPPAPEPVSDADMATYATGAIPPSGIIEGAKKLGDTVTDAVNSGIYNLPFVVRAGTAIDSSGNWLQGKGYDYSDRLKKNNDWLQSQRDKYPTYNANIPGLGTVPINGYDMLGAAASSVVPMGIASKVVSAPTSITEKLMAGTLTGGLYGAAQGASSSPDLTNNYGDTLKRIGLGGVVGAGLGAVIPAVSTAGGALARGAVDALQSPTMQGYAPKVSEALISALKGGKSSLPTNLASDPSILAPNGVVGDLNPNTQNIVNRLAGTTGDHLQSLENTFANRNPNDVVTNTANNVIPLTQTQNQREAQLLTEQKDFGQNVFKPAMETATPVPPEQISPILDDLNDKISHSTGSTQAALVKVRDSLTAQKATDEVPGNPGTREILPGNKGVYSIVGKTDPIPPQPAIPTTDPQKLHSTIMQIDNLAQYGDGAEIQRGSVSATNGALGDVRKSLSGVLKDQIPGYSDAMDKYSQLYKQRQALVDGAENDLNPTVNSKDFIQNYNSLTPEEQAEKQLGMTYKINNTLASKTNDVNSLSNLIGNKSDNNYQKIAHVFGQDKADSLLDAISSAKNQAKTNTLYNRGNQKLGQIGVDTLAEKIAASRNPPAFWSGDAHDTTWEGAGIGVGKKLVNSVANTFRPQPPADFWTKPLTNAMTMGGQDAQNLYAEALRRAPILAKNQAASNFVRDALARGTSAATIPPAVYLSNNRGQ